MKSLFVWFTKIKKLLKNLFSKIKIYVGKVKKKVLRYIDREPYKSFFITLGVFLFLIVISNILGSPKPAEKKPPDVAKQVKVYTIGSAPKLTVQAQVEKSGVVHITALTSGVVQSIKKHEGGKVYKGETLLTLSSNYQGGNISSLGRQLAQVQYQNIVDTYDAQKDVIKKQMDIAQKLDVQADDLRSITDKSLQDTNDLINLNNEILSSIDKNISQLESTNVNGSNDALILAAKEVKSGFLAATNQAKQASRSAQYSSSADQAPAQLSNLQKEFTLKQLDMQNKMLDMNKEISRIQLQIARVSEAMMYPSAPFTGTIQKVFVKVGQQVNPGTELMVLSEAADKDPAIAIAYVSADIASKVSKLEPSIIHINNTTTIESNPSFISRDAIQGSLYGVFFNIPDQYISDVTEKGFIQIDLPIGYFDTGATIPYIPIDAIYQTKESNYVFTVVDGKAQAKIVELGNVFGSFVEIIKGLSNQDKVVLDRNVIAGDKVNIQ